MWRQNNISQVSHWVLELANKTVVLWGDELETIKIFNEYEGIVIDVLYSDYIPQVNDILDYGSHKYIVMSKRIQIDGSQIECIFVNAVSVK